MGNLPTDDSEAWPSLPLEAWAETCATLHMWLQIIGKIRLTLSPWVNHSWHVTLYVTARGLTTSPIPLGSRLFQIDLDFVGHRLFIQTGDEGIGGFALEPMTVAAFYARLMEEMAGLRLPVTIRTTPCELVDPIPFEQDESHRAYDRDYANRYWRILAQTHRIMSVFRAKFIGKCSPVQLFWGSQDLAVSLFSGRRAPEHPGGMPNLPDWVTRDAYSHEVSSCGFWPGSGAIPYPAFYAYVYPEPPGYAEAPLQPGEAFYSRDFREFILPYDAVRRASSPDSVLLGFFESAYEAAANLGRWDRASLERQVAEGIKPPTPCHPDIASNSAQRP
ncbi:MAG: DUF5996 family protein [Pseudomonadota bacterium]